MTCVRAGTGSEQVRQIFTLIFYVFIFMLTTYGLRLFSNQWPTPPDHDHTCSCVTRCLHAHCRGVAGMKNRWFVRSSPAGLSSKFRRLVSEVCHWIWNRSLESLLPRSTENHLLWALLFWKLCACEHTHDSMANVSENTFRKLTWAFVNHIASLPVISMP